MVPAQSHLYTSTFVWNCNVTEGPRTRGETPRIKENKGF